MRGFNWLSKIIGRLFSVILRYLLYIVGMFPVISWGVVGYWFLSGFDVDEFIQKHQIIGVGILLSALGTLLVVLESGIRSVLGAPRSFSFLVSVLVVLLIVAILGKLRKQTGRTKKLRQDIEDMGDIIEEYEKESERTKTTISDIV